MIVPDIFEFSVHIDNPNQEQIAKDIIVAMDSGKRIKLHYDQQLYFWSTKGNTDHFITKVDFLESKKGE